MLTGKRILIVDDSPTIRKFLHGLLARGGVEQVDEAGTGEEALALLRGGRHYDLLLLDLMLPDLDGLEVLNRIRQVDDRCAIVMITGTGGIKTATIAVKQGADGYIGKQDLTLGNDPADFILALDQALERREGLVAQKELEAFKADFYAMVTHDLRSPTGSILLCTDMLLRSEAGPLAPEQAEIVVIANNAARRLLSLINNYLDYAKINAGYLRLDIGEVELCSLVQNSAQFARIQANAKEQSLTLDLPDTPIPARADGERVKQVIDNLITNSIKYTPVGGQITVQVRRDPALEQAVLRISDTGYGIPVDQVPELFTKYHRVSGQATRSAAGTGLGLLIVKEIVTAHGGGVRAESEGAGKGTTIVVTLPLNPP
jgi:two-component system, NarL family, sensor histidine kinase BarA